MEKCYNVSINGKVQDIGFRAFIEDIARFLQLRGFAIVDIAKEEIPFHIYLPQQFTKFYTDEIADIGRKLDKGNELLRSLPEIKSLLDSFVLEQRDFNKEMREHN